MGWHVVNSPDNEYGDDYGDDDKYADYEPDIPNCDGSGVIHVCKGNTRSMNGPHYWCDEFDCDGCVECDEELAEEYNDFKIWRMNREAERLTRQDKEYAA